MLFTKYNTSNWYKNIDAYPIFTVYTGYGFHPRCISGCINYFTADYGVTAPSNLVSIGNDQSGNNNNATQATSGKQPTLSLTGLNSLPCIIFNGTTSGMMQNCSSINSTTSVTLCFVCYFNIKSGFNQFLSTNGAWTTGAVHCLLA